MIKKKIEIRQMNGNMLILDWLTIQFSYGIIDNTCKRRNLWTAFVIKCDRKTLLSSYYDFYYELCYLKLSDDALSSWRTVHLRLNCQLLLSPILQLLTWLPQVHARSCLHWSPFYISRAICKKWASRSRLILAASLDPIISRYSLFN